MVSLMVSPFILVILFTRSFRIFTNLITGQEAKSSRTLTLFQHEVNSSHLTAAIFFMLLLFGIAIYGFCEIGVRIELSHWATWVLAPAFVLSVTTFFAFLGNPKPKRQIICLVVNLLGAGIPLFFGCQYSIAAALLLLIGIALEVSLLVIVTLKLYPQKKA